MPGCANIFGFEADLLARGLYIAFRMPCRGANQAPNGCLSEVSAESTPSPFFVGRSSCGQTFGLFLSGNERSPHPNVRVGLPRGRTAPALQALHFLASRFTPVNCKDR